ncbi:MAG: AraC family transcriptional regulator [Azospira oryzae]|nr:MAG: AraC family transcriptional regulator [Azospira oryzae]
MITFPHLVPHPRLQAYVSHYFVLHLHLKDVPPHQRIRPIPPDAEQSLYFYPRSQVTVTAQSTKESRASAKSIFVGQQTSRVNLQFGEDHLIIQVCFRPGVIHQLLGKMPMTEFDHKERDAEDLSDPGLKELNERLGETEDHLKMISLIEDYLLRRLAKSKVERLPVDRAIEFVKNASAPLSLDWVADQACLSSRQFERKFLQMMGMSPKFYSRIVRFDKAYKLKLQSPHLPWMDIAYQCGYFDLSHLMRDFRQFAEVTPSMIVLENSRSPENLFRR